MKPMVEVRLSQLEQLDVDCLIWPIADELGGGMPAGRPLAQAAGPEVVAALEKHGAVPVGAAIITAAGDLDVDYLIHVSVESPQEPVTVAAVERAFLNGLRRAGALGLARIGTPALGTGVGRLEAESVARAMESALRSHGTETPFPQTIVVAVSNAYEADVFERILTEAPVGS